MTLWIYYQCHFNGKGHVAQLVRGLPKDTHSWPGGGRWLPLWVALGHGLPLLPLSRVSPMGVSLPKNCPWLWLVHRLKSKALRAVLEPPAPRSPASISTLRHPKWTSPTPTSSQKTLLNIPRTSFSISHGLCSQSHPLPHPKISLHLLRARLLFTPMITLS